MTRDKRRPVRNADVNSQRQSWHLRLLFALGVITTAGYGAINALSWRFRFDSSTVDRPIIAVLFLFAAVFAGYLLAIWSSKRATQNARLVWLIVGFALLFRIVMVFSYPIQEVDLYRYLWDGEVSAQGVSPFRFAPAEILTAQAVEAGNEELSKLVALRDKNPEVAEILKRVHFGELPTIYPPTSQLVFHAVAVSTPDDATVLSRVWIMKAWLVCFDLGVLFVLLKLLALCRLPIGLSAIYAWCPLVMKEVANSGHLDSIAVFLTLLAIYVFARVVFARVVFARVLVGFEVGLSRRHSSLRSAAGMLLVAIVLAAAVGAKLYPVVLAPLVFGGCAKCFGLRFAMIPAGVFVLATFLLLTPLIPARSNVERVDLPDTSVPADLSLTANKNLVQESPSVPDLPVVKSNTATDPSLGVATFIKYWEMNDFIFLIVVENLKLNATDPDVWFSVVPEELRQPVIKFVAQTLAIPDSEAPFLITRATTSLVFLLIAIWLTLRTCSQLGDDQKINGQVFCESAFLTLAWFWLLLPTQNPWYWMWALPLLPFMRNRAWLAVSGLVLVYYLRFWLDYHFSETPVGGTCYNGTAFFDFVVTWIEYAPWFVWLVAEHLIVASRRPS